MEVASKGASGEEGDAGRMHCDLSVCGNKGYYLIETNVGETARDWRKKDSIYLQQRSGFNKEMEAAAEGTEILPTLYTEYGHIVDGKLR